MSSTEPTDDPSDSIAERRRAGRWRSGAQSRQRILDAARTCFAQRGYGRTTVRGIAAEAGVDPAMVFYFFATKEGLFTAATRLPGNLPGNLAALFAGGIDDIGPRLIRMFLESVDSAVDHHTLVLLTRSAPTHDESAALLRDFLDREIADRLVALLGTPDARLRVGLVTSLLLGLAVTRYVVVLEPVASASRDELVDRLGALVQACLTGPVPTAPTTAGRNEGRLGSPQSRSAPR